MLFTSFHISISLYYYQIELLTVNEIGGERVGKKKVSPIFPDFPRFLEGINYYWN